MILDFLIHIIILIPDSILIWTQMFWVWILDKEMLGMLPFPKIGLWLFKKKQKKPARFSENSCTTGRKGEEKQKNVQRVLVAVEMVKVSHTLRCKPKHLKLQSIEKNK